MHYLCHHHLRWVSQMHFFTVRSSCHAYLNFNVLLHFLKTFSQKKLQRVIRGSFTSSWRFRYSLMPFSLLRRLFLEFYFSWMRLMSSRCRARKPSKCTTRTELELFVNYLLLKNLDLEYNIWKFNKPIFIWTNNWQRLIKVRTVHF